MKRKHFLLTSIALGLTILGTSVNATATFPPPSTLSGTPTLAPMLEQVLPSVVSIAVEGKQKSRFQNDDLPEEFKFFFGPDIFKNNAPRNFKGLGSGVIINAEKGYVLTNNHVIDEADKITVKLQDGREFKAKLVGADELSDIALIQLEDPKNLTEIKIADSDKLRVGDYTVAVGNPFGLGQTVTSGIVSALGRSTGSEKGSYENYIQTDAAVNQGNSGGPLLNLNGELIGINTAIISPSGGNAGIAFAIPSNMANSLAKQILEFGEVRRGLLGIKGTELNADLAKALKIDAQQGAFVSEVLPDSAAEKAELRAGDVITAINGQKLSSFSELRAKIATTGAGQKVKLTYLRDGKSNTTSVILQQDEQANTTINNLLPALEGIELSNYNVKGKKGVEISKIKEKSLAQRLGLKEGDVIIGVNRTPIENLEQLRKALKDTSSTIALNVLRGKNNFYLLIQ
ncbi:Do family serine endopeptidase [Avibacterium paragallinarum]|uniref:Protease Do n=1 Tax=Avibacterium paragallinarum TaxID=728 RepID=A0A377I8P0_AVIPA|nr:Do family serine endopeptidase [Avibacterium paragallinarum]POY46753.1 PDZ domain-containing protein [Avibacterium paragallinarum]RZN77285.1 Do family serine endopeptidase [Avibacterium paragallinarum]CDF99724.1 Putative Protease DegQ [Avibacterium paragallinarum JF4211]STO71400.1 protease Do [Avibacterium paragallinarum]